MYIYIYIYIYLKSKPNFMRKRRVCLLPGCPSASIKLSASMIIYTIYTTITYD